MFTLCRPSVTHGSNLRGTPEILAETELGYGKQHVALRLSIQSPQYLKI